jgi:BirA family biotin operon repressor/biotin-[acetyl-CoA-carboxylase] ligase
LKLIKLSAIDSTSSFLKELSQNSTLENYTAVVTNEQTKGRGQQANSWVSIPNKNLTMSVYLKGFKLAMTHQKYLNFAISLAIFDILSIKQIEKLSIKWPNDIMSANKKICGILIENSIRSNEIYTSIVGIGLNVNQVKFPDFLEKASSLKKITNIEYNLDLLLLELMAQIKVRVALLKAKKYRALESDYLEVLYKKNIPTMFKDRHDVLFMGIILGISETGNLHVELDDETVKEFGMKEISIA